MDLSDDSLLYLSLDDRTFLKKLKSLPQNKYILRYRITAPSMSLSPDISCISFAFNIENDCTRKKHLQDYKCFLYISSFLSAPPLLSIFCSSFLSFEICSQCGSACDSLSLCIAFAPANRFARYPGPGRIGSVHDRHKKRHSFECPFFYLSAASYPPGPLPAKYFRRL